MKKNLKILLIPVLFIVVASLSFLGVITYHKIKESKRIDNMNQSFRAENLRGLWNVEGEDFTLLFYFDNDSKMHIRSSYGFDPNGTNPIIDVIVDGGGYGSISGLRSNNGNTTGVSLTVKDEYTDSYNVVLNFSDMNNSYKSLYTKDVVITKSDISFDTGNKEGILTAVTELLINQFSNYNGEAYVPMDIKFDETNKSDGLINNGQVSGKAIMVKQGFNGTESLDVTFSVELVTNPYQFSDLNVNGYDIIHNYKFQ